MSDRIVLETKSITVKIKVKLPNGLRIIDHTHNRNDNTWQASSSVTIYWGNVSVGFSSNTGMGYGWGGGGGRRVSAYISRAMVIKNDSDFTAQVNFDEDLYQGRGITGPYIEGWASVSGEAQLCLYTWGRDTSGIESPTPDDNYPTYGGAAAVGEYPEVNGRLLWEFTNTPKTLTISFGPKTASIVSTTSTISDSISIDAGVIDDSWEDSGGCTCTVGWEGMAPELDTRWREWWGKHDGFAGEDVLGGKVEIGTGFVNVMNRGWIRSSVMEACSVGVNATLAVPRLYQVDQSAYLMDNPYPDSNIDSNRIEWTLLDKWIHVQDHRVLEQPIPHYITIKGPAFTKQLNHNFCALNAEPYNKAISYVKDSDNWYYATDRSGRTYQHYENDLGPVQCWISHIAPNETGSGTFKDWRVPFRGLAYKAFRIDHDQNLALPAFDDSTSDDDVNTYNWDTYKRLENYRYLIVNGDATRVTINAKSWNVPSDRTIDLCYPDNTKAKSDHTLTRYPVEYDDYSLSTIEGSLWGVTRAKQVIGKGNITSLSLTRRHHAKSHFLEVFDDWTEWHRPDHITSQGDTYDVQWFLQRCGIGDVDGRQTFEVYDVLKSVNAAPNRRYSTDYYHQSLQSIRDQIAAHNGYSTTATEYKDSYHNLTLGAYCAAQGYYQAAGDWNKTYQIDHTDWVYAQPLFDSFEIVGLCGDAFGLLKPGSDAAKKGLFVLTGRKVFRSSAYGLAMSAGNDQPAHTFTDPAARVQALDKPDTVKHDVEVSPTSGYYWINPTQSVPKLWGAVRLNWNKAGDPYLSSIIDVGDKTRRIDRVAFANPTEDELLGLISYDVSRHRRHVIAEVHDYDGVQKARFRLGENANGRFFVHDQIADSQILCKSLCVRYSESRGEPITLIYQDENDTIKLIESANECKTWGNTMNISTSGYTPAFTVAHGQKFVYWLAKSGETYNVKGLILSSLNVIVKSEFTALTGVGSGGIAVDSTITNKGAFTINMIYTDQDKSIKAAQSTNGIKFTTI
jgi:hypothetical protein